MILKRAPNLAAYVEELESTGQIWFRRDEAIEAMGVSHGAFLDAAGRLARQGHIFAPRRGFYVITPTRFLKWGAPPPSWYVDAMMEEAGRPYYVGLLKAAELHGAAHQAVMEFQIMTDRQWKPIRAGRSKIVFYFRKEIDGLESGIERRKTDTGSMRISSPALTALDLIRYPWASGHLNHAASVLNELAPEIDPQQLRALARSFERTVVQRLGYIFDQLGHQVLAGALSSCFENSNTPWIELDPGESNRVIDASEERRDQRWHVIIRRPIEIDEQ
jgi:predicted transcriptional regulator of viral defense system